MYDAKTTGACFGEYRGAAAILVWRQYEENYMLGNIDGSKNYMHTYLFPVGSISIFILVDLIAAKSSSYGATL